MAILKMPCSLVVTVICLAVSTTDAGGVGLPSAFKAAPLMTIGKLVYESRKKTPDGMARNNYMRPLYTGFYLLAFELMPAYDGKSEGRLPDLQARGSAVKKKKGTDQYKSGKQCN